MKQFILLLGPKHALQRTALSAVAEFYRSALNVSP
jgi:hypothetical protein